MSKAKEITVSIRQVKNLGNYQSLTAEASATVQIEDGDNVYAVYDEAWNVVKAEVGEQLNGRG